MWIVLIIVLVACLITVLTYVIGLELTKDRDKYRRDFAGIAGIIFMIASVAAVFYILHVKFELRKNISILDWVGIGILLIIVVSMIIILALNLWKDPSLQPGTGDQMNSK